MTLLALALLVGAAWLAGRLVTRHLPLQGFPVYEQLSLTLTAGLGLVALLLSILAWVDVFAMATGVLAVLAACGVVVAVRSPLAARGAADARWARIWMWIVAATASLAALGAVAPVTDDDALAYVLPIARKIAESGTLAVWPDQARSMWPQSQQVLLAYLVRSGATRLGALTALEWLLLVGVISALARRLCARPEHVPVAVVLAIGCPVVALQVASAKEDLLLVAAAAAAVFCVSGARSRAELIAAGTFAGIAAGAKYSGLAIAVAVVAASAAFTERTDRAKRAAIVAGAALVTGGFWYALNLWRFGNPVAPMFWGAAGTPLDPAVVRSWTDAFGGGDRGLGDFFLAPFRIFLHPELFASRGNLFNPLVYAGVAALFVPAVRRKSSTAFLAAAVLYVAWYATLRNARLLLPAAVLLAPAAADLLVPMVRPFGTPFDRAQGIRRALRIAGSAVLVAPLVLVAAVGVVRAVRYLEDPATYLARETQRYDDMQWMNAHLDPARHRVGARVKVLGYLRVPSLVLDSSYQIEISEAELSTVQGTLNACLRQRVTHLFGQYQTTSGSSRRTFAWCTRTPRLGWAVSGSSASLPPSTRPCSRSSGERIGSPAKKDCRPHFCRVECRRLCNSSKRNRSANCFPAIRPMASSA